VGVKKTVYKQSAPKPYELKEAAVTSLSADAESMVRTQIYLSRAEHDFVRAEAERRNEPMASVIRGFIDERMGVTDAIWHSNPLLQPPVDDPDYVHRPDGVVNHDHYIYGGPKKHKKVKGKWVALPSDE
jgi:hypothetical protein